METVIALDVIDNKPGASSDQSYMRYMSAGQSGRVAPDRCCVPESVELLRGQRSAPLQSFFLPLISEYKRNRTRSVAFSLPVNILHFHHHTRSKSSWCCGSDRSQTCTRQFGPRTQLPLQTVSTRFSARCRRIAFPSAVLSPHVLLNFLTASHSPWGSNRGRRRSRSASEKAAWLVAFSMISKIYCNYRLLWLQRKRISLLLGFS